MPDGDFLLTVLEDLQLHAEPGPESPVIEVLAAGSRLHDLEQVSSVFTKVAIFDTIYWEPWIKVSAGEKEGWILPTAYHLKMEDASQFEKWMKQKRLNGLFGSKLVARLAAFKETFHNSRTEEDVAFAYSQAIHLRDTLVTILGDKVEMKEDGFLPDLFWLKDFFPAFVTQLVAEGTSYYLFADYRVWGKHARETEGQLDDRFFEIQYLAFPFDSTEHFFPAWTIQTWDYGGHSLLGRGVHQQVLDSLGQLWNDSGLFKGELNRMKQMLVDDISLPHITYWESAELAKKELDGIISKKHPFFLESEYVTLMTRRKHFDEPQKHGVQFNHKAGIYQ